MAQLPPKIPNMSSSLNTFVFAHQKKTPSLPTDTVVDQQTWVDNFLDFYNSGKRGLVPPNPSNPDFNYHDQVASMSEFHQMEDNQMMSMFVNVDAPPPPPSFSSFSDRHNAAASTPSDQNSNSNDDEDEDVQIQNTAPATVKPAQNTVADPKRVKRILANRQSAQRSRVRKLQYISELERSVTYLQTEVSALSPQVAFLEHQRSALNASNNALRQRIAVLAQDKVFKEAHQESLKQEIERLSQAYQLQQNSTATPTTTRRDIKYPTT